MLSHLEQKLQKKRKKYMKKANESDTSPKKRIAPVTKGSRLKTPAKAAKSVKKKQSAKKPITKGLTVLSEVALSKAEQLKLATKRSKIQFHSSHASGLGDGVDTQLKVPNEQQQNISGINEGASDGLEVPDVPGYKSKSEEESWTISQGEEIDMNDDSEETESDNDGDNLTHPNLSTYKENDEEEEEEKTDDAEMSSDQRVSTPPEYELTKEEEENKEGDDKDMEDDQEEDEEDDLYRDVNINLERYDYEMTDAQAIKEMEDAHVTVTAVPPVVQQQSTSVSSDLVSNFINPTPDTCIDLILNPNIQSHTLVNVPVSVTTETPSSNTTILPPPIPIIQPLQQTPESTTTTTIPTMSLPDILNFASLFLFEQWVSVLKTEMSEFKQTNQFADDVSSIPGIVDNYLTSKIKETVDVVVQLQTNKLREEAQAENQEFINQIDSTMKKIIKELVQAQVSKIMPKIEKYVTESLGVEVLVRSTNQPQTSYIVAASLLEFELKKILIDKIESNKSIDRSDIQENLYNALDEDPSTGSNRGSKRRRSGKEAESSKEPTHKESKSTSSSKGASRSQPKSSGKSAQAEEHGQKVDDLEEQLHQEFNTRNDDLAQAACTQSLFNKFLATPIDFSAFIMNRLKIENLTQDVLTDPTYDLMKGTCKSVVELEYHLEEVFKATNDQLDWHNPEGRPYPHDLSKHLPLIPNARGRQVIPFDHFINNDLEYLKGGTLSQRYTTSITKTKAADYGQVKWIEDKVPGRIWSPKIVVYDKHAYWGTYYWGPKCQKFNGYAANMETSKDVYSRHMINAVTSLKIMQFFWLQSSGGDYCSKTGRLAIQV
ncbi:hypothetical protein Tco_1380421 [Tanacetum coccineum]